MQPTKKNFLILSFIGLILSCFNFNLNLQAENFYTPSTMRDGNWDSVAESKYKVLTASIDELFGTRSPSGITNISNHLAYSKQGKAIAIITDYYTGSDKKETLTTFLKPGITEDDFFVIEHDNRYGQALNILLIDQLLNFFKTNYNLDLHSYLNLYIVTDCSLEPIFESISNPNTIPDEKLLPIERFFKDFIVGNLIDQLIALNSQLEDQEYSSLGYNISVMDYIFTAFYINWSKAKAKLYSNWWDIFKPSLAKIQLARKLFDVGLYEPQSLSVATGNYPIVNFFKNIISNISTSDLTSSVLWNIFYIRIDFILLDREKLSADFVNQILPVLYSIQDLVSQGIWLGDDKLLGFSQKQAFADLSDLASSLKQNVSDPENLFKSSDNQSNKELSDLKDGNNNESQDHIIECVSNFSFYTRK